MVQYLSRAAWGARPPEGRTYLHPADVLGVAFHHPGTTSKTPITSQAAVASALRGWQAYHMDVRGWSDIAYGVAVDQAGRAWTLRGLNVKSAANGDVEVNLEYGAILLVLVAGEEPSAAMKATARAVVADFRKLFPRGTRIVGHRDIRPGGTPDNPSTTCPGEEAYAVLRAGGFTPSPTPEDDDVAEITPTQMNELKRAFEAAADAAARRWALWQVLYGLETEDDLQNAREEWRQAYDAAIDAGQPEENAVAAGAAAAERVLRSLREAIKTSQD